MNKPDLILIATGLAVILGAVVCGFLPYRPIIPPLMGAGLGAGFGMVAIGTMNVLLARGERP